MEFLIKNKKWFIISGIILVALIVSSPKKDEQTIIPSPSKTSENKPSSPQQHTQNSPQSRGDRLFGISISEDGVGFDKSFSIAQSVGVKVIEIPIPWDEYESKPGQYVSGWLPVINKFYSKAGTKISLSLNPIDTNNVRLPKDIKNKAFNDPVVIERYKAFVDFIASQVPDSDIFFVAVGNEIDIHLGKSEERWQEYSDFYNAVAPHVKEKFPHAVIGSKITFDGIMNLTATVKKIEDTSDVVLVTYYPFTPGTFIVRDPVTVHDDFKRITKLYPNKKIYFAEIGYPSGELNGSSEAKQAEFIREAFSSWDTYATEIPFLNFFWLHDKSPGDVSKFVKYYGLKDKSFASFLGTLGLRTYDGKDKPAFIEFRKAVKDRGW